MEPKGFTLIEVLLSLSIVGILAGLTLPLAGSLLVRHDVDIAAATFTQNLRRAQILSQSGAQDSQWGVIIQTGLITLFRGTSYAARDSSFDETTVISSRLTTTGDGEIVFAKISGDPSGAKTILLTEGNEALTITLNTRGVASY